MLSPPRAWAARRHVLALLSLIALVAGSARADEAAAPRPYRLPAGDARETLRLFAEQSGEQIVYLVDTVRGTRTHTVRGTYLPLEALTRMLAGTPLTVRHDPTTGAMTVVRESGPVPAETRRERRRAPLPATGREDEVVQLSAFTVSAQAVDRYRGSDAISAVRVRAPLLNTPGSISVITRDIIDDLAPTRLFDVTRYVAGVEEGRGIQFADRQIIRGFESNGRTVDNFIQTGADNYEEALIERIEIYKGPNAILSPAGVPGGSINVITKSPSFTSRRTLSATVGRFDAQKLTVDATGPFAAAPQVAYRLVGSWQDSRRYWASDARLRRKSLAPMLTWRISDRTQLTLKLIGTEQWIFREPALVLDPSVGWNTGRPVLAPGFSPKGRNGIQPWSHVGTHIADGYLLLTTTVSDHVSVRLAVNARHYYEDSKQQFIRTPSLTDRYNPWTGTLTPDHFWTRDPGTGSYHATFSPWIDPTAVQVRGDAQKTTLVGVAVQNDVLVSHRVGAVTSQTVLGWGAGDSDQVGRLWRGALPPLNVFAPTVVDPVWENAPYADHRTRARSWQAYVNQRLGFLGDRLFTSAGVMHYDVNTSFLNKVGENANQLNVLDDANTMWFASVLAKPHEQVSLYYSYSTNSSPTVVNDQPLWRDGQQHEVGVKTEWFGQRLAVNVAWFDITQTNVSVPNPERQNDLTAPEHLLADLGDHGLELEIAGGLTRNLSLIAAHTELRLRDRLGRRVRAVADRNSALLLNYRFREGLLDNLSVNLGVTYAGTRAGDTTSVDFTPLGVVTRQSFQIPAYTLLNLGASYRWDRYQVRLHLDNLLDDAGYLQQAGGRVSGTGLSTATGFNARLTLMVTF